MKKNVIIGIVLLLNYCFMFAPTVFASTSISFNGTAPAFGGSYQKFSAEDNLNGNIVRYIKVKVTATGGNKMQVGFLYTTNWLSSATLVATTGTLKASNNSYIIYFVPQNK